MYERERACRAHYSRCNSKRQKASYSWNSTKHYISELHNTACSCIGTSTECWWKVKRPQGQKKSTWVHCMDGHVSRINYPVLITSLLKIWSILAMAWQELPSAFIFRAVIKHWLLVFPCFMGFSVHGSFVKTRQQLANTRIQRANAISVGRDCWGGGGKIRQCSYNLNPPELGETWYDSFSKGQKNRTCCWKTRQTWVPCWNSPATQQHSSPPVITQSTLNLLEAKTVSAASAAALTDIPSQVKTHYPTWDVTGHLYYLHILLLTESCLHQKAGSNVVRSWTQSAPR